MRGVTIGQFHTNERLKHRTQGFGCSSPLQWIISLQYFGSALIIEEDLLSSATAKRIKLYPSYESKEFAEFSSLVQQKLEQTGLIDFLDESVSTCIENGFEFFVELVLNDGSEIKRGEDLILEIAKAFNEEHKDIRVTGVVRAHWSIKNITYRGNCHDESGLLKSSECFGVELESGKGRQVVEVEVTPSGFDEIARRLGTGNYFVEQVIRKLLEHDLRKGGESFWHPIRHPKQYLNDVAAHAMIYEIKNDDSSGKYAK